MSHYTPPQDLHVRAPQIRILYAQSRNIGHWSFEDLRAPYWRLYSVSDEGAWVRPSLRRIPLLPGNVYLLPPQTSFATGTDQAVDQFFIHFSLEPPPSPVSLQNIPIRTVLTPALRDLQQAALQETSPESQALLLEAFVRWILSLSGLSLRGRRLTTRMEHAQQILRDHLRTGIPNAGVARQLHLSENGFVRWFSQEAGISPQAWLNQERVHEAGFWLHHTDASIERIAELLGFCDRYHFSRVFKRIQGISPVAFRRNREPGPHPLTVQA
jgi:AraC-like DNA-binding protein